MNSLIYFKTIAHEIGHNLGLSHDFESEDSCTKVARFSDGGEKCTDVDGVMDYCVVSTLCNRLLRTLTLLL